jgi:acetyltransferase-like isoleucine patch superfamily enzyme
MFILKFLLHVSAIIKIVLFKILYGRKVNFGKGTTFRRNFNLMISSQGKVSIGKNCFFNNDCSLTSINLIEIGDGSIFGETVKIYDNNHIYHNPIIAIKKQGYTSSPVKIGSHCWIASNVTILKGVTIGDNVVIGAGCTIFKSIPSNSIVKNIQNQVLSSSVS